MKPSYAARHLPSGDTEVQVTVHPVFADLQLNGPVTVILSADQFSRFNEWLEGGGIIQDLLPELSGDDREKLMSGLDAESFTAATREDDD